MNPRAFKHLDEKKADNYEDLKEKYDQLKQDMNIISHMPLSDETKTKAREELQHEINEIKERMHNFIDTL